MKCDECGWEGARIELRNSGEMLCCPECAYPIEDLVEPSDSQTEPIELDGALVMDGSALDSR